MLLCLLIKSIGAVVHVHTLLSSRSVRSCN